jgi:methionine-rich copper-binding protein CopC
MKKITACIVVIAHAVVITCAPLIGGNFSAPPALIICQFNQPLDPTKSTLTVKDANGQRVDKGDSEFFEGDNQTIVVSLDTSKMNNGIYTVHWAVTDTLDYGDTFGDVQFGVNTVVPPTPTAAIPGFAMTPVPVQATPPTGGSFELISRFLIGIGVIVLAAMVVLVWRIRSAPKTPQE